MDNYNGVRRSMARGIGARGTTGITNNGTDAYKQALKSTKGHYRVEFTKTYENMTDKDIQLRLTYGKDLVAGNLGVPVDMIKLRAKKNSGELTLTAHDEVYYVKVGNVNYGKLSVRTQRLRKNALLIFVFQIKKTALKPPQAAYSRNKSFKKRTTSQRQQASRKSYNSRKGGKS